MSLIIITHQFFSSPFNFYAFKESGLPPQVTISINFQFQKKKNIPQLYLGTAWEEAIRATTYKFAEKQKIPNQFKISKVQIHPQSLNLRPEWHSRFPISNWNLYAINFEGTVVHGLSRHEVENEEEFIMLVEACRQARITEHTNANAVSSRSHCIIQVNRIVKSSNSI